LYFYEWYKTLQGKELEDTEVSMSNAQEKRNNNRQCRLVFNKYGTNYNERMAHRGQLVLHQLRLFPRKFLH